MKKKLLQKKQKELASRKTEQHLLTEDEKSELSYEIRKNNT